MGGRYALYLDQLQVDGPQTREVTLLRLSGAVDSSSCSLLAEALGPHLDGAAHLLIDVSGVCLLTSAGTRVLVDCARQLAAHHRCLVLAGATEAVEWSMRTARATEHLGLYPTVGDAVESFPAAADDEADDAADDDTPDDAARADRVVFGEAQEMAKLRRMRRDLRAQVRTRPLISQAMGVLAERYRLQDGDAAFTLLRACSQEHNLKLRAVAAAVLAAPRPHSADGMWFPGRVRQPMPVTSLLRRHDVDPTNRSSVLEAVLDEVVRSSGARCACVQLVDPALDVLVLEKHRGFTEEFVDFFAHVGSRETACVVCRRLGRRVSVPDVASDPHFDGGRSRAALLSEGIRAVDCTPVVNEAGRSVGVLSAHYPRAGGSPTPEGMRLLDVLAQETAAWLAWYQRTVVLEALEHLHAMACDVSPQLARARTVPSGRTIPGIPGCRV